MASRLRKKKEMKKNQTIRELPGWRVSSQQLTSLEIVSLCAVPDSSETLANCAECWTHVAVRNTEHETWNTKETRKRWRELGKQFTERLSLVGRIGNIHTQKYCETERAKKVKQTRRSIEKRTLWLGCNIVRNVYDPLYRFIYNSSARYQKLFPVLSFNLMKSQLKYEFIAKINFQSNKMRQISIKLVYHIFISRLGARTRFFEFFFTRILYW